MKNALLVFLGGVILTIVLADWNTASWQVKGILLAISFLSLAVGILAGAWERASSDMVYSRPMARSVNGLPPPRTRIRGA